jgi:hypothetical protein
LAINKGKIFARCEKHKVLNVFGQSAQVPGAKSSDRIKSILARKPLVSFVHSSQLMNGGA